MSTFDISQLAAQDTFDVPIINPATEEPLTGEDGKPCSVTAYGPGTKQYAAAQTRANNRFMKRLRAKGKSDTTPEEDIEARAAFLTDITKSFNNFTYKGGDQTADTFRACYLDMTMGWLTNQVNAGAGDWGNYSRRASAS